MGNLDRSWQWVTTPWQNWLLELEEELITSLCGIFACLAAGRLTMKRLLGDEHPSGISKHPINWAHPTWWCSPRSYYKQMGKKAHQHSMTFLASLRKSLVKYMAMKIYSLISEAEFNPQDLIIPDKAQDMYLETKRKKKKRPKEAFILLWVTAASELDPLVKPKELWNVLAQQEGVFTRLSCNAQCGKLYIRWERLALQFYPDDSWSEQRRIPIEKWNKSKWNQMRWDEIEWGIGKHKSTWKYVSFVYSWTLEMFSFYGFILEL